MSNNLPTTTWAGQQDNFKVIFLSLVLCAVTAFLLCRAEYRVSPVLTCTKHIRLSTKQTVLLRQVRA